MLVYRIARTQYARDLTGLGARLHGGRWNSEGIPMIYCSSGISLCTLEIACNSGGLIGLTDMSLICLELLKPASIYTPSLNALPKEWDAYPAPLSCARFGDQWVVAQQTVAMCVPSAVIHEEMNYLLNPEHPAFAKSVRVKWVKPFNFDPRLIPAT